MVKWIRIEPDWALWIDADTFDFGHVEKRAPIYSIVIVKDMKTPKERPSYVDASYGIVGKHGLIGISKRSASEILSNRTVDYIQRTRQWPPCMNLKRVLKSGDVELTFTLTNHDRFTLRVTAEMVDDDPLDFLLELNQYEKPRTSQRGPNQLIST